MANLILWSCVNKIDVPIRAVASYQLASWLRYHGYTVKVIEFCHLMSSEDLAAITEKHIGTDTLAIGVSSTFWNSTPPISRETNFEPTWVSGAREIVDRRHKLPWLLGGYGIEAPSLKLNWIKFYSHGEDSLLKWMDENSSKLVRRELFDVKELTKSFVTDDYLQPFEVVPIELGRGCQFKCKFCSYPLIGKKKGTYLRNFNLIEEEFIRNYEEWGITKYYFQDDTVNESEEKVRALAEIAQRLPFKLEWVGYIRLDLLWSRPDTIQLLKDSGLRSAYFGIESFHPVASMAVGKGWNGKQGKEFLLRLKEMWGEDINWLLSFIIGLPGEDRDSIEESFNWCVENKMYEWKFFALAINNDDDRRTKSEFDAESEKYGYSFPSGDKYDWKNDLWMRSDAIILADELRIKSNEYCTQASYLLASLTGLGYTFDEIMHQQRKDLDWIEFKRRTTNIVRNYVDFQLQ